MPNAIESFSMCYGVDTSKNILGRNQRALYVSRAINRSMDTSLNDIRPPFTEIEAKFQLTEDEYVFRNAAITGMKFYAGEPPLFSSFLIVAVGDRIMAGFVKPGSVEFFTIYKGIDPQWLHSFFGQALNILTYQNGKSDGLYWKGDPLEKMRFINESSLVKGRPMVNSNLSVFAHGRFFVATAENLVYASDYIYSQGLSLEQREAVLSFSESFYPSSGDGFGAPSEMGAISGMIAVPQSDTLNGHGDIMVFCKNGVFSIAPNRKVRNQWTSDPEMQKSVMVDKGCLAHNSISIFANQIMYRDSNGGVSSLNADIANYQNRTALEDISEYVKRYLDYDSNSSDIQFAQSITTGQRILFSVAHVKERSVEAGVHRYGQGFIVGTTQKRNQGTSFTWEGLWTGLRPVASVYNNVGGIKNVVIASFDADKQNRLYTIRERIRSDDYSNGKNVKIASSFTYQGLMFDEEFTSPLIKKTLNKVEILMIDSHTDTFSCSFSVDGDRKMFETDFQLTELSGHGLATIRNQSNDICSEINDKTNLIAKKGYFFSLHFFISGPSKVVKAVASFSVGSNRDGFESITCNTVKTDHVSGLSFVPVEDANNYNDFSYILPYGQR